MPYQMRSLEQIAGFFQGLELVDPGVVAVSRWRPDNSPFEPPRELPSIGAVGRKC